MLASLGFGLLSELQLGDTCSGQVKLATGLELFHTFGNLKCFR